MRKGIMKRVACAVMMTLTIALAACGKKVESVEDYLSDPTVKAVFDKMAEASEEDGMTVEISAKGNEMIYTYTLTDYVAEDGIGAVLEAGLEAEAATFEEAAADLDKELGITGTVVTVRYLDGEGTVMAEKSFTN